MEDTLLKKSTGTGILLAKTGATTCFSAIVVVVVVVVVLSSVQKNIGNF
jgi:hypothetical protein